MIRDPEKKEKEVLLSWADIKNKDILEIGCGDGYFSKILIANSKKLIAIDTKLDCINANQKKWPPAKYPQIEFALGDGCCLSNYRNGEFDLVVFSYSLHETGNPLTALREAYRLTKNGGQIIIFEPQPKGELCQLLASLAPELSEENELRNAQTIIRQFRCHYKTFTELDVDWQYDGRKDLKQELLTKKSCFPGQQKEFIKKVAQKVNGFPLNKKIILADKVIAWFLRK